MTSFVDFAIKLIRQMRQIGGWRRCWFSLSFIKLASYHSNQSYTPTSARKYRSAHHMRLKLLPALLRTAPTARRMPQLTLSFDTPSKSLGLSPSKPTTSGHKRTASSSAGNAAAAYYKSGSNNLWKAHHEEENLAAAQMTRRKAEEKGEGVHMHDAPEDGEGRAKGQPGKRGRSPDGDGGVAGRDAKKSKNAYEISGFWASRYGMEMG